jgi:nitrite reductase/ring-hydroxylating ferredoxin subunit
MNDAPLPLCALTDLDDPGSRGFSLETPAGALELFLVRREGGIYAYRNNCPHTGAPLDWTPDRFLSQEGELIQCAMHGALFRIESGECLYGPCRGAFLQSLPLVVRDGQVALLVDG